MKKHINLIPIICVVVAIIIAGVSFSIGYFLPKKNTTTQQKNNNDTELLRVKDLSGIEKYKTSDHIDILLSDDKKTCIIDDAQIFNHTANMYVEIKEDGKLSTVNCNYFVPLSSKDKDSVISALIELQDSVAEFFDVDNGVEFRIYSYEKGELDTNNDKTITAVLNGEAEYMVTVADFDNTYWGVRAFASDDGQSLKVEINHILESGYIDGTEDIVLN